MSWKKEEVSRYLEDFKGLLLVENVYSWSYDAQGNLLQTNCPERKLSKAFSGFGFIRMTLDFARGGYLPLVVSLSSGLIWGAVFEKDEDELVRVHILGPMLTHEVRRIDIEKELSRYEFSEESRHMMEELLGMLNVHSLATIFSYVLMMDYFANGTRRFSSDIRFISKEEKADSIYPYGNSIALYAAEQELLHNIREGCLGTENMLAMYYPKLVEEKLTARGDLAYVRATAVSYITLCSRAAIEGGVPPETAYDRAKSYTQNTLDASSPEEITNIAYSMFDDFLRLSYQTHMNQQLSKEVQSVCDYISLHLSDELELSFLAERAGYSAYYFSRKFHGEMGITINEYIRDARIAAAKSKLAYTDASISDIAEELRFSSRNAFSTVFKKYTGMGPAEYRKANKRV